MVTAAKLDLTRSARLFHALSDPTRLRLLLSLRGGERCVCELMDATDAAQSRVSFHLKVLKDAGLLLARRQGRWVHYRLNRDVTGEIEAFAARLEPAGEIVTRNAC